MKRMWTIMSVLMVLALLFSAGVAQASEPVKGGTLRVAIGNDIQNFDPVTSLIQVYRANVQKAVFNMLYQYDETGKMMEIKMYSESGRLIGLRYRDDVDFDPYEQASMYMLLGGRSAAFYDTTVRREDEEDILEP